MLVQLGLAGAGRILELLNAETELDENAGGYSKPIDGEVHFVDSGYNVIAMPHPASLKDETAANERAIAKDAAQ